MGQPPLWQRVVVGAQAAVNPVLRAAIDQEEVAGTIAALQVVRARLLGATEAPTRRLLHLLNLPAGSDVNRLLVQIASLEREVREMRKRVEDSHAERPGPYA